MENDYQDMQASLRKFDSPMVKEYKFYATKNVDHKVTGYHKYNVGNGTKDALDNNDLINYGITLMPSMTYKEERLSEGGGIALFCHTDFAKLGRFRINNTLKKRVSRYFLLFLLPLRPKK